LALSPSSWLLGASTYGQLLKDRFEAWQVPDLRSRCCSGSKCDLQRNWLRRASKVRFILCAANSRREQLAAGS
jgi:hypothetical protein